MPTSFVHLLAHEGNGAVEISLPDGEPLLIVLIGPIKHWWGLLDTPAYQTYAEWRDAVRVAMIHEGHLVYAPHRAWQGAWHEKAQRVNDHAVQEADVVIAVTPPGIPAEGTAAEIAVAQQAGVPVLFAPPGGDTDLLDLIQQVQNITNRSGNATGHRTIH